MGRRTLNAHKLQFNKLREKEYLISPADISGESLIDIVERWTTHLNSAGAVKVHDDTYISVEGVRHYNDNILIIDVMSGKSGEPGIVHDLEGMSEDIPIGEKQAPMSSCRALLFSPNNGQMAMWFSEYSARSSGARYLLSLLKRQWPSFDTGTKFNESRVIMSEALLEGGKITEIEVRFTRQSPDLADGAQSLSGTFSHVFRPKRKTWLSAKLLNVFRKNPAEAYGYVELSDTNKSDREVFVSIDVDGHKRKIRVTDPDDGIYYHEELNGPGEHILTDEELVAFCTEEAVSCFDRSGYCWEASWSKAV